MDTRNGASSKSVLAGLFLLAANGWGQYLIWFGDQGLVRWRQTQEKTQAIQRDIHVVRERIRQYKDEILLVEQQPSVLEEVARRDLGLIYPDEILFVVKP
ncbi:MAG: septum formation initiator family protein [Magnetococcales bacterium]|nr:septum formation initiator family protein [Magnetococcales bacterium]